MMKIRIYHIWNASLLLVVFISFNCGKSKVSNTTDQADEIISDSTTEFVKHKSEELQKARVDSIENFDYIRKVVFGENANTTFINEFLELHHNKLFFLRYFESDSFSKFISKKPIIGKSLSFPSLFAIEVDKDFKFEKLAQNLKKDHRGYTRREEGLYKSGFVIINRKDDILVVITPDCGNRKLSRLLKKEALDAKHDVIYVECGGSNPRYFRGR